MNKWVNSFSVVSNLFFGSWKTVFANFVPIKPRFNFANHKIDVYDFVNDLDQAYVQYF